MDAPSYNPCHDGIPAKLWECLRRNEVFRTDLAKSREIWTRGNDPGFEAPIFQLFSFMLGTDKLRDNVLAGRILIHIGELHKAGLMKGGLEDMTWPQLPKPSREALTEIVHTELEPDIKIVPKYPDEALFAFIQGDPFELARWALYTGARWGSNNVVAIPKFVRDKGHREKIISALEKIVRTTTKTRAHFRPDRGFLGAPKEWETFLFVQTCVHEGMCRESAFKRAAWKFFKTPRVPPYAEVVETHPDYPTSAEGLEYAEIAYDKQGGHITNRFSAIQTAINEIYPSFAIFARLREFE